MDDNVDVVAREGKPGHANHIVDAHSDGALALADQRRQSTHGSARRQFRFGDDFALDDIGLEDAVRQRHGISEGILGQRFGRAVGQFKHVGTEALATMHITGRHYDLVGLVFGLVEQPMRRQHHGADPKQNGDRHRYKSSLVFHEILSSKGSPPAAAK